MNMIKVEGLTKRFSQFTAVNDISFQVGKNEMFGLLAPNEA
jgi:ABC-2 type transport system ATP-binding protein